MKIKTLNVEIKRFESKPQWFVTLTNTIGERQRKGGEEHGLKEDYVCSFETVEEMLDWLKDHIQ